MSTLETLQLQTLNVAEIADNIVKSDYANALQKVVLNIADQRYGWKAKRSIDIIFTFSPDANRHNINIEIDTNVKLPKLKRKTTIMVGHDNGRPVANESQYQLGGIELGELGYDHINAWVGLETIGNGGVLERFDVELQRVIANILDVNMPAEGKRKIEIKFIFQPTQDRGMAAVQYGCKSTLCSEEPLYTFLTFTGIDNAIGVRETGGKI